MVYIPYITPPTHTPETARRATAAAEHHDVDWTLAGAVHTTVCVRACVRAWVGVYV